MEGRVKILLMVDTSAELENLMRSLLRLSCLLLLLGQVYEGGRIQLVADEGP